MSKQLDIALASLIDEQGLLGRPVPAGQIEVPEKIWMADDYIHWRMGRKPRIREVSRSMLNRFVHLPDNKSVLSFAKDWGVLTLSRNLWSGEGPGEFYLPSRERMTQGVEPIRAWRYYSRRARAVLNIAAALKAGKLGDNSDWDEFAIFCRAPYTRQQVLAWANAGMDRHVFGLRFYIYASGSTEEERLRIARVALGREVQGWLDCWKKDRTEGNSDFSLSWMEDQQRWDLRIDYHGFLFPAIALQLALVFAEADSLFSCSGCGIPYIRPRTRKRPKAGWANYCDQCAKDGIAKRRAVENYRNKRAEAKRLHAEGCSVPEIANRLETPTSRVESWLIKDTQDAKT